MKAKEKTILENYKNNIEIYWRVIALISAFFVIIVQSLYFIFNFGPVGGPEQWGQFGDFIGGTLNSIFGFLGFIILLKSLAIQSEELRLTREELKRARIAHEDNVRYIDRDFIKRDCEGSIKEIIERIQIEIKIRVYYQTSENESEIVRIIYSKDDNKIEFFPKIRNGIPAQFYNEKYKLILYSIVEDIYLLENYIEKLISKEIDSSIIPHAVRKSREIGTLLFDNDWLEGDKITHLAKLWSNYDVNF